jgi:replicative DNA helicase
MNTRTLPADLNAEKQLLGCILLDQGATLSACLNSGLTADMFSAEANRTLYSRLVAMLSDGKPIELSALALELTSHRELSAVGGYPHLTDVSSAVPTTAHASIATHRIKSLSVLRKAIGEATGLIESCYQHQGDDIGATINAPITRLLGLTAGAGTEQEPEWADVVDEAEKVLESIIANQGVPESMQVPFPWPCMNNTFQPMQRGQLVIIGARPSVGKSSLARPIAAHAAATGRKVYFVTLEVNPVQVALQMAAAVSRIGIRQVARAHAKDQADLKQALRGLRDHGITISRRDRSLARIAARVRALHAQGQIDLLVVDHGLLIEDVGFVRESDKKAEIGRVTKTLKTLATDLGIVCVLLWQLNRASVKDGNREPNLSDLKDSGSLEEDADKVIFIHRPAKDGVTGLDQSEHASKEDQPRYFQNLIQAKGRDDGTAFLSFYFDRATASFNPATK